MMELKKLSGEETGVSDEFKADWEAEKIDFYEDVAYGMGGEHPMCGWQEYSSEVKAVCDWYCGGDMTHMGAYVCPEVQARAEELGIRLTLMPGQLEKQEDPKRSAQREIFEQMFGMPGSQAPELSMDISPIFYVDQKQPLRDERCPNHPRRTGDRSCQRSGIGGERSGSPFQPYHSDGQNIR